MENKQINECNFKEVKHVLIDGQNNRLWGILYTIDIYSIYIDHYVEYRGKFIK